MLRVRTRYKLTVTVNIVSSDCSEENLSKMKQLILETFQKELHSKQVTSKSLIDELYFRYNRDGVDSISGSELKSLVTDYVIYHNIKELAEICHPTRWLKAQDKDGNGFLSKGEFSRSFGKINWFSLETRKGLAGVICHSIARYLYHY